MEEGKEVEKEPTIEAAIIE
jgi:polo-like kinase 1